MRDMFPLVVAVQAIAGERSFAGGKSELHRAECRVTPGEGDLEESATENRPPARLLKQASQVRVKRWSKSPPRFR
jgi:hypothetical protein